MTEDRNITAVFQPKKYELQVDFSGVGSVTGAGEYSYGANIPISAQASLGYEFSHWEGFGIDANTSSTTIQISADQTIRAIFLPQQHNLTVSPYNSSHGTTTIIQSAPIEMVEYMTLQQKQKMVTDFLIGLVLIILSTCWTLTLLPLQKFDSLMMPN